MSFTVLLLVFGVSIALAQFEGDSCTRRYDNSAGTCTSVRHCPKVRDEYKVGIPLTVCAYLGGEPIVCCPDSGGSGGVLTTSSQSSGKRISIAKCEEYGELTKEKIFVNPLSLGTSNQHALSLSKCDSTTPLILGGEKTKNGEYPHMAAIGWRSLEGNYDFKCGGMLISDRFVLTAAHCYRADGSAPSIVRLGDQNLKTRSDGMVEVDVPIAEFIKHEKYRRSSYYDDIALIRLTRSVTFSKTIRPACLWQAQTINSAKTVATGWGYTESFGQTSDELKKVHLDIIENQQCNRLYEDDKLDRVITSSQMCAGVLRGDEDICNGDFVGPIQITTNNNPCLYYIIGIASFGSPFCGQKNSPGVYTRVSSYIDWIEANVWG